MNFIESFFETRDLSFSLKGGQFDFVRKLFLPKFYVTHDGQVPFAVDFKCVKGVLPIGFCGKVL